MTFDDLDARMRRSETAHDHCVLPGLFKDGYGAFLTERLAE